MSDCKHEKSELRYITAANGVKMYCLQCLECGKGHSKWQPKPLNPNSCMPFDYAFEKEIQEKESQQRQQEYENQKIQKHLQYENYINASEKWQKIRQKVLKRCNFTCEACLEDNATQVHHENYQSLYNEVAYHLRGVCQNCHKKIHGIIFNG